MTVGSLILWRHGETDWNRDGRLQGHHDIAMNEKGRRQARAAAAVLAKKRPARIVSSDLQRARDTAEELAVLTGLSVETDPRLREINVGHWVGLTRAEIAARDEAAAQAMASGADFRRSAAGETGVEMGRRMVEALREIAEAGTAEEDVVVATHGMAARTATMFMVGGTWDDTWLIDRIDNCAWTVLAPGEDGVWRIRQYNVQA